MKNKTLKQRLAEAGFTVHKVYWNDGRWRGVEIKRNGIRAHKHTVTCYDYGLSLCAFLGV